MASSFLPELSGLPNRRLGALLLPDRLDPRLVLLREIPQEPDVPALELAPVGSEHFVLRRFETILRHASSEA